MKCPRCQQENPAQASFCMTCGAGLARAKRSTVGGVRSSRRKRPKSEGPQLPDLEKRLAEALKREAEAVEQQTATSEILRVIAGSPTALQPVLDAVAESAARLCAAHDAAILRLDGDVLHSVAHHGPVPYIPGLVVPAIHGTVTGLGAWSTNNPGGGSADRGRGISRIQRPRSTARPPHHPERSAST